MDPDHSGAPSAASAALVWTHRRARSLLPRAPDLRAMVRTPRRDLVAGLTVGVVALPLALGFGISSGLGAAAGLATAIVAGALAALFGGSHLQVSGPTGAMTVVLIPIVAQYGADGVLVVGVLAGLALLAMAAAGWGKYVRFIPVPVIEGFTLGIAVIIGLQQVPGALGVHGKGERILTVTWDAARTWFVAPHFWPLALALGGAALMLAVGRWRPAIPGSLLTVVGATALAELLHLPVARIGALPSTLPVPSVPQIPWSHLHTLLLPALAVAALAALESLLSATVVDAMSVSERHDPDRELFGQGVANLASPLFGGIPATAAIARTAVNVRSGAHSRLAALTHAGFLLLVVLALSRLVSLIPLAALAGVLLATAVRMLEGAAARALMRASRSDAAVLVVTAVATIALDLVTAVILGIVTAGALALRAMAHATTLEEEPLEAADHADEEHDLLDQHIVAFRLDGPLFFWGAHQALLELSSLTDVRVVILRLSRVATLDTTGAAVLRDAISHLENRGITVLLSGVPDRHAPVLDAVDVYGSLAHERHVFATTPEAIAHARVHASRISHAPA